jgi:hypothetical protein
MTEWNIQSRAHACQACGQGFQDKETYHTLLFNEKADFRRADICQGCWLKQYSDGARDRKGFVSYWQGVYEAPVPPSEPIQKDTAESLLRKIIELNDPRYVAAAYILAVMLERKRLLKVKEQVASDGRKLIIYEQPKSGDVFTVVDPELMLNQLEQVQREVGELLEHGLPSPERIAMNASAGGVSGPQPAEAALAEEISTGGTEAQSAQEPPPAAQRESEESNA